MSCCPNDIRAFFSTTTTLQYTSAMAAQFGPYPKVKVYHQDETGYVVAGIFTRVELRGNPVNEIFVSHGTTEPVRGIIKFD